MKVKAKIVITLIVITFGFVFATVGLLDRFVPSKPDNEIMLLPMDTPNITISNSTTDTNYLKANILLIDGHKLEVEEGGLLLANRITMENGGEILGSNIYVVATIIDDGKINASYSRGIDGGNVFVASAQINGTEIMSNGKDGENGEDGENGSPGVPGSNGRNGKCSGFGGWRPAKPGGLGGNGQDGENGGNGQDGGNAGNIIILTSYNLTIEPESNGGSAGKGGKGGAAGVGGKGGRGGRGCTGLGGSQGTQPSGRHGNDGVPGKEGQDGAPGKNKMPTIKLVEFNEVLKAVDAYGNEKNKFVSAIREIGPRNIANK